MSEGNNFNNINNNQITNKLILKYDEKFNELYEKKVHIDSSIKNKEELITKENEQIQKKIITIQILQYCILFIIFYTVLIVQYYINNITSVQFTVSSILLFIVFLLILNFNVYRKISLYNIGKHLRSIEIDMKEYVDKLEEDIFDFKCPAKCPAVPENVKFDNVLARSTETLNIDPQLNVWKYGDIPTDLWTSDKLEGKNFYSYKNIPNYNATQEESNANEPKPFFGTTYPSATYYKCEWLGGDNSGLPIKSNNSYSSIPCKYKPNFSETGRYICSKNPNKLSKKEFNTFCNNVSV